MRYRWKVESPLGSLTAFSEDSLLTGLYFENHRPAPVSTEGVLDIGPFRELTTQLEEFFAGQRTEFSVPMRFDGTDFQETVWLALSDIPYGETVTYGELATKCGREGAARAIGSAVARNPISIVNPCHRVVGSAGKLTGFAGGLDRKNSLLELEQSHRSRKCA